jgi:AraC family transcriptional regulator of adaptative response / DNA-3-methyladenine glycosylase II
MLELSSAAGFSSVRRFNDAIRKTYDRSPSELRGRRRRAASADLCLRLSYRPPYDWTSMLDYLSLRATPGVEVVRDGHYLRSFALGEARGILDVEIDAERQQLVARVRLSAPTALIEIADRLKQQFDLAADPGEVVALLGRDARLRRALCRHPGLRVPGAFDPFELAVRAILGQQVSVKGATTLAGRLASAHGDPLSAAGIEDEVIRFAFPQPAALAEAPIEAIGLPAARAGAIRALACAVRDGQLALDATGEFGATLDALRALPGVGDWTAQYIAMRALREPDAFPASDLGLRKALASGGVLPSVRAVSDMSESWRPCRAYAAILLWSRGAAA